MRFRRVLGVVAVVSLGLVACGSDDSIESDADEKLDLEAHDDETDETNDTVADTKPTETEPTDTEPTDTAPTDTADDMELSDAETAEILAELQANGFCDPADAEEFGTVTAMHFVVQSVLQPPCFGEGDDRLGAAWQSLAEVTPSGLLNDVSLLASYEGCDDCDTVAFVSALDEGGSFFMMAVDVEFGAADPDDLALTMQHELTHVFTQHPETQLDITVGPDECDTYYNGSGCFREGAYAWEWIQEFWDDEALATIPEDGGTNPEAGDERCALDAPFTGAYGASNPEEDMAEVFSAYVFDVEMSPSLADKLAFFDRHDELREVRDNAAAAGRHTGAYSFEGC